MQAFLDAVAAIVIPEEINEETGPALNDQIGAAQTAYEALSEEELAREDVAAAAIVMQQAIDALTGGAQTLPENPVAKIGEETFDTLQVAFSAANKAGSATIELLENVNIVNDKLTASNSSITVNGNGHSIDISFDDTKTSGGSLISVSSGNLTFANCSITLNDNGNKYNGTITLNNTSSLTFNAVNITLDGANASGNRHGIYLWENKQPDVVLNVINGSSLTVKNYPQDALEWNGNPTDYFNIENSEVTFTNNRSGIAGTINITVTNSTLNVINNNGNGSNGSNYDITNSTVNFCNNTDHGLSASNLYIKNSTVTADNNGRNGIVGRDITIDASSHVHVEGNTSNSGNVGAFRVLGSTGRCTIDAGADVQIINNFMSGIQVDDANGVMVMNAGVVTGNGRSINNGYGGGVRTKGSFTMSDAVVLYNNHASDAGDDIYVYESGSINFASVHDGWALDNTPDTNDCEKAIDGWYDDAKDSRWDAHNIDTLHVVPVTVRSISGVAALKAAHGIPTESIPVDLFFYKLDSVTEEPIPGVEFSVYSDSACKNLIDTLITGIDGVFCLEDVQPGVYYLKETKAAPGYKAITDVFTLTVDALPSGTLTENTVVPGAEGEKDEVVSVVYPSLSYVLECDAACITDLEDGIAIVNDAVVDITIRKVWVDNNNTAGRTKNVEISLRANGKELEKVVLSDENKWAASYTLPKYDENGKEIKYSIVELTKVNDYVTGYSTDGFTVYNTLKSLAPKTGDESNPGLWLGLMGLSAACVGAALILGKKRRTNG